jgi:ATP-binding cassette subfamily F protein 3
MSLLTVQDLALGFAGRTLFSGVGFQVSSGDRVGLIGPNGSGKTSLMRLLAGELQADKGDISMPKGARLGYLAQDVQETLSGQLLDFVLHAIPGRRELEERIAAAERRLEEAVDDASAAQAGTDLGVLHGELAELDDRHPRHEAEVILHGLGFRPDDMERDLDEFSGGWRTRAALGALLYQRPDVLLMDEPTNHLDIPSVRWLEGFLQSYPGAMILICHDRDFLNRQIQRILSLEPEGLRAYTGDYDAYLVAREEEKEILEGQARNQEKKMKDAKRFIERFRYKASKARQAQSKIKLLEKMEIVETYQRWSAAGATC